VGQQVTHSHKQWIGSLYNKQSMRIASYHISTISAKPTHNQFRLIIFGNISRAGSQASINPDMATFIGRYVRDIPARSSWTVTTYFIERATTKNCWAFERTKTVKTMYIEHNGQNRLWLTMMTGQHCLHSIDAHWQDGEGSVSHSLVPQIAANIAFMTVWSKLPPRLPKIHD
jgi:hypothetical protein